MSRLTCRCLLADRQVICCQSQPRPGRRWWLQIQRIVALLAGLLTLPLLALLWIAAKLTSPGPFLYTQTRRGLGDRPFRILKIRTLAPNSEAPTRLGVRRDDPHVTRLGRFLRHLKLDELPQLWNVACGHMQLVGPRPIPMELDDFLRREIPQFAIRTQVLPGLTSPAQLQHRENACEHDVLEDWRRRFELDLECMRRQSVLYDLGVLARTVLFLIRSAGTCLPCRCRSARPSRSLPGPSATLVLGTPIANLTSDQVVQQIAHWVRNGGRRYVAVCSAHSLVEAVRRPAHRRALAQAAINTADGMPVVWAQRLFGHRSATRVYGPTLMLKTLDFARRCGWRVALYGGRPERLHRLTSAVLRRFPGLRLVEAISPPFRPLTDEEDRRIVDRLRQARPDVLFIGLGCPKQEQWMLRHVEQIPAVMIGVGAAFDFHCGAIPQAPRFLQQLGLEWAFRLCCEPSRLLRRYLSSNPAFVALVLRQWIAGLFGAAQYQVPLCMDPGAGLAPGQRIAQKEAIQDAGLLEPAPGQPHGQSLLMSSNRSRSTTGGSPAMAAS